MKKLWNSFLGKEMEAEDPGPPFSFDLSVSSGIEARELAISIQIDMSDREQLLHGSSDFRSPGEPDQQLRSLLAALEPGFFGWSGAGTSELAEVARRDGPGVRELDLILRLPAMRAEVVTALVRALQAGRRSHGVSFVRISSVGGSSPEPVASLDHERVIIQPPFELVENYYDGTEAFTALIELRDALSDGAKAELDRLTKHYATLLGHGALPSDFYPCSDGHLEEADDPLPNQWAIEIREYQGSRAAWDPLIEALSALHLRLPVGRLEIWG